jgi:hypothetical protein
MEPMASHTTLEEVSPKLLNTAEPPVTLWLMHGRSRIFRRFRRPTSLKICDKNFTVGTGDQSHGDGDVADGSRAYAGDSEVEVNDAHALSPVLIDNLPPDNPSQLLLLVSTIRARNGGSQVTLPLIRRVNLEAVDHQSVVILDLDIET